MIIYLFYQTLNGTITTTEINNGENCIACVKNKHNCASKNVFKVLGISSPLTYYQLNLV